MGVAVYDSLDSTNALLMRQSDDAVEEGAWILARVQTGGRGRQGRAWQSLEGNLHASTMVRLRSGDPPVSSLSLVSAIALFEALIAGSDIPRRRLRIKWPNDLIARRADAWCKIGGILLEREGERVIIGFGANLGRAPDVEDRQTTCVDEFGDAPDPVRFCLYLERSFASELERWRGRGLADIRRRWLNRAHPQGTPLAVHVGSDETLSGSFAGLEPDGALRLHMASGVQIVRAGDVAIG